MMSEEPTPSQHEPAATKDLPPPAGEATGTTHSPTLDWQLKLESLQSQHRHETLQQQQEHLEQLKLLQQQLLQDLSVSATGDTSMDTTLLSEVTEHLGSPNHTSQTQHAPGPSITDEPLTETHIQSEHTQTAEQDQIHSAQLSAPSSPSKADEVTVKEQDHDVSVFSSTQSLEFLQLPRTGSSTAESPANLPEILVRTSSTKSLEEEVGSNAKIDQDDDGIKTSRSCEDSTSFVQPPIDREMTSKVPSFTKQFRYQSPPLKQQLQHQQEPWAYSVAHPPLPSPPLYAGSTLRAQSPLNVSNLQQHSPNTSVSYHHHHHLSPGYNPLTGLPQTRGNMLDKHRKHIEDLKKYYEAELTTMKTKLDQLELKNTYTLATPVDHHSDTTTPERALSPLQALAGLDRSPQSPNVRSSPHQQQLIFPSSLAKERRVVASPSNGAGNGAISSAHRRSASPTVLSTVVHDAELKMLESENARLKEEYSQLQAQLDHTEREKYAQEDQVKRLQQHVLEWQERCESSERMTTVLQDRLETTRTQLYNQDKLVGQLQSDLQVTSEELHFWKEQRGQDIEKLEQLFHEFEVLQTENSQLRSANSQLETELEVSSNDLNAVRATLDKYHSLESTYKSTIHRLEDEVRHLQHVNNRLHSQATHYALGVHGSPFNRADEEKVQHATRDNIHSPNHQHHVTLDHTHTLTSTRPPMSHSSVQPEHHHHPPPPPSPAADSAGVLSSMGAPLTRKKWLEPSIPGLICGGGPTNQTTTIPVSSSRTPTRITLQDDSSKPVKPPSPRKQNSPYSKSKHKTPSPRKSRHKPSDTVDVQVSPLMQAARVMGVNEGGIEGENPIRLGYDEALYQDLADSTLDGAIITTNDSRDRPTRRSQRKPKANTKLSIEEQLQQHIRTVTEAESKLVVLQSEKEKLESALQKTPKSGSRVSRQLKQSQFDMEQRLEDVVREIGSVRMTLRRHHALKK